MQSKTSFTPTLLFLFFCTTTLLSAAGIPESKVPQATVISFHQHVPQVKKVAWELEKPHYEAEFILDKINTSVLMNAQGMLLSTEQEIPTSALPLPIQEYLKKNKLSKKVTETSIIKDAQHKTVYEVEIKNTDYLFSEEGTFLEIIKN